MKELRSEGLYTTDMANVIHLFYRLESNRWQLSLRANSSAQAAGQAALRARTAYERTLGNVKAQSEKLAQDMLASVKHEARLQATVALQKRNSWEAASLQAAHDAGAGVQAKYEADSKAAAKSSADLQARAQDYVNAAGYGSVRIEIDKIEQLVMHKM